jgi:hypothetical protein
MTPRPLRLAAGPFLAVALASAGAQPLAAQDPYAELTAGSELERYLRVLQVAGEVPLHPWSVRAFSPREADRLTPRAGGVWSGRHPASVDSARRARASLVPLEASLRYNSAFPYGFNDGPVWAGRGVTVAVSGGAALRLGPLSARIAPTAFRAENRGFQLMDTGREGNLAYGDPVIPTWIDLPQRFGDGVYARVDAGQSEVRLDVRGVSAGVSTANQGWGPALHQPIILGWNAPGFLHAYAGTRTPANVGIGRVQGRIVWGRLEQSEYSPARPDRTVRFATGAAFVFTPRWIPGLEVGGTRFFHLPWGDGPGLREAGKLFEVFSKSGIEDTLYVGGRDNQLASVFFRWVAPSVGLEVFGEYGREDHSWDTQDLILQPDHSAAYLLGAQKVWRSGDRRLVALRGELLNAQRSQISVGRIQLPYYVHPGLRQGHTHRGQVLGAPFGKGGGGSVLGVDVYRPWGRWSAEWVRGRVAESWTMVYTRWPPPLPQPQPGESETEVLHALGVDLLLFRGPVDLAGGVSTVYNLNRHFERDAFNLNGRLAVRLRL